MKNIMTTPRRDHLQQTLANLFGKIDTEVLDFILPLLEWKEVLGNSFLFHQGEQGESLYILLSGQMQAIVRDEDQTEKIVGEISRGETVGEMSVFSGKPRSASVKAIRDSQLVKISKTAFNQVIRQFPEINLKITSLIVERLNIQNTGFKPKRRLVNIALVPLGKNVPIQGLSKRLEEKMRVHGDTLHLSAKSVNELFGKEKFTPEGQTKPEFLSWLDEKEQEHDYLIFQADHTDGKWTRRCMRQADEIILIGNTEGSPESCPISHLLEGTEKITSAAKKLVLLHNTDEITGTAAWLEGKNYKAVHHIRQQSDSDLERLARFLTGNAIGLVLSGGGAKGLAHIGVFKALKEKNIPVDFVGGTSFGSIPGSLIGMDKPMDTIYETLKNIFLSNPTPLRDYNFLPMFSILSGKKIDALLKKSLGDQKIEDMPVNFFCVSANLSKAEMATHQRGLIRQAIRASISLPGVFPPAVLKNDLHVDGAMFNNLPIDIMEDMGVGYTIAVDLDHGGRKAVELEKMPTTWEFLKSKIFKTKRYRVPNIMSTMMQSSMINSIQKTRKSREAADLFINPNVSRIGLMDWKKFHKIVDIGYQSALQTLENWAGFK